MVMANDYFIHFLFILIKKAITVYMLTCSEAVPQRCSHEQVLRKMRGKPTGEHPCRSMISMELPHSFIKINSRTGEFAGALRTPPIRSPQLLIIWERDLQMTKKALSSRPGCVLLFWKISKDCNATSKVVPKTTPSGLNQIKI